MKTAILIVVLCIALGATAPPPEQIKKMQGAMEKCMKENGVTPEEFGAVAKAKPSADQVKENIKCTIKCFMVENGFLDNDGNFKTEEAMKHINEAPDKAAAAAGIQKCGALKGKNACDTAFVILKCLDEQHGPK